MKPETFSRFESTGYDSIEVQLHPDVMQRKNRKPRAIFDRVLAIVGIAFDVKNLFQELGILPDQQSEKFARVLSAIGENYNAIQRVGEKVDRNFVAMQIVHEMVRKTLSSIEETRMEMLLEFKKVLDTLEELKVGDKISSLATFMDDFHKEISVVNGFSPELRVVELNRPGGLLDKLSCAAASDGILHGNLNHIINERLAILGGPDDNIAFAALQVLYYGVQTYVSVFLFVLDQYSFLSDFYYNEGNTDKSNGYFDLLQINFELYKKKLSDKITHEGLIDKVRNVLIEVQKLLFVRNHRPDIFKFTERHIESLKLLSKKLEETILPIDTDQPETLTAKPDFANSTPSTPIGSWRQGATVSYAVQCQSEDSFSKISQWSSPIEVSKRANPLLKIPVDRRRRIRLIYRKFNAQKPELVGIVEDIYQTDFRDIDRDAYDAAFNSDEEIGLKEFKIFIKNGANSSKVFENGKQAMHAASQNNNIKIIDELLENEEININVKDTDGVSPIYIAAESGYDNLLKFLINRGSNVNITTQKNELTPLHIAARNGFVSTVSMLVENEKVSINSKDSSNYTPLHNAVYGGAKVMKILISKNETAINAKSDKGLTPLHLAAIENYVDSAELLIDTKRADTNAKAEADFTPLHFSSALGNTEITRLLIRTNGTDVNAKSAEMLTPLHLAISSKKSTIARILLNLPHIEVNSRAKGNITPLHMSVVMNEKNVTSELLEKNAFIEERTRENLTPLHIAVIHNYPEIVTLLLDHGADIEASCNGSTSLHLASFHGNKEAAQVLLDKKARIKTYDKKGLTPVHVAASEGKIQVLRVIIDSNPSLVNMKSLDISKRSSPLHFAVQSGYLDIIKYLVEERSANFSITNKDLDTPLHFACKYGNIDAVHYLVGKKTELEFRNRFGETPLHLASLAGRTDIVRYLIDIGKCDINASTSAADSVLHYAASSGNLNLVKYLIDEKQFLSRTDTDWYTPLDYAFWFNKEEVYKYIQENVVGVSDHSLNAATLSGNLDLVKNIVDFQRPSFYPLRLALRYGFVDIVRYFMDEKNVEFPGQLGLTALHMASLSGDLGLVKYFVEEKKLDVNSPFTLYAITPLCLAALSGNRKSVKYLVDKGARTWTIWNIQAHPFSFAVASGDLDTVRYFMDVLKINVTEKYACSPIQEILTKKDLGLFNSLNAYVRFIDTNLTPFNYRYEIFKHLGTATGRGHLDIVKYFIDEKKIDGKLEGLVFIAVRYNNLDEVKYFVEEKKVNIDIKDADGNPLLFSAIKYLDIIEYFVDENNANVNIRNGDGDTLLHIACKDDRSDVVKYLIEDKKYDINTGNIRNFTPLHKAVKYNSLDIANYLVAKGADVKMRTKYGTTALHICADRAFVDETPEMLTVVENLVNHGADVNAEDDKGDTPLDFMRFLADSKIKKYLLSKGAHRGHRKIRDIPNTVNHNYGNEVKTETTWMNNLVENLSDYYRCIKSSAETNFQNFTIATQRFDMNSTVLLLDVFVKQITKRKYISSPDMNVSLQESKIIASNIVTEFQEMLERASTITGRSVEDYDIDFYQLYLDINKRAINGRFNEIPNDMYVCIENSSLKNDVIQKMLKCEIQEILNKF